MEANVKFFKKKRAVDYLPNQPHLALGVIWDDGDLSQFLYHEIYNWFYMALANPTSVYQFGEHEQRETFIEWFSGIPPLVDANYFLFLKILFYSKHQRDPSLDEMNAMILENLCWPYESPYFSSDEVLDPLQVIAPFCNTYPIEYSRKELWDMFEGAQGYSGILRERVSKRNFADNYTRMSGIIETSYHFAGLV